MYYSPAASENCIRGFFHLGFQASYAQVRCRRLSSTSSRLTPLRNHEMLGSRTLKTDHQRTSIALVYLLTGMRQYDGDIPIFNHPTLTLRRTWPNTFYHTVPSLPRSVETLHLVSARRLDLLGTLLPVLTMLGADFHPDSRLEKLLNESSKTFTVSLPTMMVSSFSSDLPTPRHRSNSSYKVKSEEHGEVVNTATRLSIPHHPR